MSVQTTLIGGVVSSQIEIKVDTALLNQAVRELGLVSGNIKSHMTTLIGLMGAEPTAILTVIGIIMGLILKMRLNQQEYERFIRKERGLKTHEQYQDWQTSQRRARRMSYRGDTN